MRPVQQDSLVWDGERNDSDLRHQVAELPSIHEICLKDVPIREHLEGDLAALAEKELLRCLSNATQYCDKDAWTYVGMEDDTQAP